MKNRGHYGRAAGIVLRLVLAMAFVAASCTRFARATIPMPDNFTESGELVSWNVEGGVLNLRYERMSGRIAIVNGAAVWITTAIGGEIPEKYSYAVVDRRIETGAVATDNGNSVNFGITQFVIVNVLKSRFETSVYSLEALLFHAGRVRR